MLSAAAGMRYFDRIDAKEFKAETALSNYGLRNPKRTIEFDGDQVTTLYLGKDAASEERIYVRTNGSRDVFLVSDELLKLAFRDPSDYRDRRLSDLTPDQVDRVIIRTQGGEIELIRDATGWRIVKPLHALADEVRVEDFLKETLGAANRPICRRGLRRSQHLWHQGGQRRDRLLRRRQWSSPNLAPGTDKSGSLFGQFTARNSVYRRPAESLKLLRIGPDALRDRRLLPLNLDIVDLIRIRTPGKEFSLRRSEAGWVLKDGPLERPASAGAVQALADALSKAKVLAYDTVPDGKLAVFGLERPRCIVSFCGGALGKHARNARRRATHRQRCHREFSKWALVFEDRERPEERRSPRISCMPFPWTLRGGFRPDKSRFRRQRYGRISVETPALSSNVAPSKNRGVSRDQASDLAIEICAESLAAAAGSA